MMRGIDISNWQSGIEIAGLPIDFCICKASEGIGYTDPTFSGFISQCMDSGKLFGYYHFARENEPETEAEFFQSVTKDYEGAGLPVLDYETNNPDNVKWCERFINRYHELTGIWCVLYLSASQCGQFSDSWLQDTIPLWVAGYPIAYNDWVNGQPPYNTFPFTNVIMWQFTSSLDLDCGYRLDGNIAYIDITEWACLCKPDSEETEEETVNDMHCLIKPDGKDYMVYYDGVNLHDLDHPDEMEAVKKVYKETTGKDIPVFEFGTKAAPWFHRFADAVSHGHSERHM